MSAEDPEGSDLVFASRYSDMTETLKLLNDLNARELISPTAFSTSVHNAVPGFATLIKSLQSAHTGISAGADSFAMGLTEALTRAAFTPERPVTYLFHDAVLPTEYRDHASEDAKDHFTLCLSLSAVQTPHHVNEISISNCAKNQTTQPPTGLENARSFVRLLSGALTEVRILGTRRDILVKCANA